MRTLTTTLLGSLLLTAAACGSSPVEQVEATAPVPVTVEPARMDTLTSTISVTGSIVTAPGGEWTIVAPGAARIAELPKAENDVVRTGDLLVRFDLPSQSAELAARRAEITQATAKIATAKAKVARLAALQAQGVAAAREVEEARLEQADAEAALALAQGGVTAAESLTERAVVRAKFDGVVVKRWHNPGEMVDASASDPILRVIDPRHLQVLASVPMTMLGRIVIGHSAKVIGPGGGEGDAATVLTTPAEVDPATATADVRLSFAAPTRLPAGAVVQVEIVAEVRPNVLVVPTAAIVREESEVFVMVVAADNVAHKQPVVLGLETHDLTEIKSGLQTGAAVIVRGQEGLPDGGKVLVQK